MNAYKCIHLRFNMNIVAYIVARRINDKVKINMLYVDFLPS